MNSRITSAAAALIIAAALTSCGKDKTSDKSSVTLEMNTTAASEITSGETSATTKAAETTTQKKTTEAAAEEKTEPATDAPATEAPTEAPTAPPTDAPTDAVVTPAAPSVNSFGADNLLSDASPILSSLGSYSGRSVSQACTSSGNDVVVYTYPSLELQCYIDGGIEYIFDIKIMGAGYSAEGGLTIGSSRSDVEAVLGTGDDISSIVCYYHDAYEVDIEYNGDTVTSIEYYAFI